MDISYDDREPVNADQQARMNMLSQQGKYIEEGQGMAS